MSLAIRVPRALLVVGLLTFCVPANASHLTVLDQETGSTLSIASRPWLFAREEPSLAANSRDYVGLHAVEINTAGRREYFVAVFFWSTIDRRGPFAGAMPRIELAVNDRRVTLQPEARGLRELGIGRWPVPPPGKGARFLIYRVDTTLIRQLGASRFASLRLLDDIDGDDEPLVTWKSGQPALRDFIVEVLD